MNYKIIGCILSSIIISGLFLTGCGKNKDYSSCLIFANGACITKIAKAPKEDNNYWLGAEKLCGGAENLPKATDLTKIASFIYEGSPLIPADARQSKLRANDNFNLFDIDKSGYFYIFSDETEQAKKVAYVRTYYTSETAWKTIYSDSGDNIITVCIDHSKY